MNSLAAFNCCSFASGYPSLRNAFRIATSTSLLVSAITVFTTPQNYYTLANPYFCVISAEFGLRHWDYLLNNLIGSAKYLAEFKECTLYLPDRFPARYTASDTRAGWGLGTRLEQRQHLQVFLKGSQKKKEELRRKKTTLYSYFDKVWNVKNCHQVLDLPPHYLFLLVCCYGGNCPHPLCQTGKPPCEMTWFPGGPSVKTSPMPVPDPSRPWGNPNCASCHGVCAGHYLSQKLAWKNQTCAKCKPPSAILSFS